MKRAIAILLIVLSFSIALSASAADIISLQFSYPPIDSPSVTLLPNGYYEAVYYTPNSSDYWLDQGRNDVSNCVVEVFNASGQSLWSFPVFRIDILQDDADAFFYQNVVLPDQIVFEYYWDHSYERYVSKEWGFDGEQRSTSFDSIKQSEEFFRYIRSQYPYTLETWPFGEEHSVPAKLTYVVDGTTVDLPFAYGVNTTFVDTNERFYMLYEADDIGEGEPGVVYLLMYAPDTHELTTTRTNLTSCSGHIAISNDTLVFLQAKNEKVYVLYNAALNDETQEIIRFTAADAISVLRNEVIDNIIPAGSHLLCLKGKTVDANTEAESQQSELCVLAAEGKLVPVQSWDGEVRFLQNSTTSMQFVCEDGDGGYQIVKLDNEDITNFISTSSIYP